jgi:hypothetical protein
MTAGGTTGTSDLYILLSDVIAGQDGYLDGVTLRGIVKVDQPNARAALADLERAVSEVARVIATGEVYGALTGGEARMLTEKLAESAGLRRQTVYAIVASWTKKARTHRKKEKTPSEVYEPTPLSVVREQIALWQGESGMGPVPCVSVFCAPACPGGGNVRNYKLSDGAFHRWVRAYVSERLDELLLKEQVDEIVETLAALAMLPDRPVHRMYKRVAGANLGPVWINLATEELTIVKITAAQVQGNRVNEYVTNG